MSRAVLCLCVIAACSANAADELLLTSGRECLQPVIVSGQASGRVRAAADTLASYLSRMSGAPVPVETGTGARGIAVGLPEHFPALGLESMFDGADITRREEYLLRAHAGGLLVVGATELAVEDAVWDLLYRLGYRQYFPGATWEVVPEPRDLQIGIDSFERPAYLSRRIWYGYGPWDYAQAPYDDWCAKNRCVQGITLNTGHSYDGFVKAMREAFDAHPEYWPLLDGERKPVSNPKPCLGNPQVRALFVAYALSQLDREPPPDSVSVDPSDGGGWCECDLCAGLGPVSDRVITLANEVAEAAKERHAGRIVGTYAYNYHSPPPSRDVHEGVVVSVATAFIKGGLSLDEIISGWSAKGATLGIREYYSVNTWDRDQPAAARGGNLDYLRRTIPEFHAKGARFMSAESSDNWGPNGLGYYLAARMLWDVAEADRVEELTEDFLSRAFGPAREPMRAFYAQLDGSKPHLVVDDQLGRMYRALEEARALAGAPDARARVDALALYARYCTLYRRYAGAKGEERQAAFEVLIRHAYRMRETMLVHTKALYRDLAGRDKTVSIAENAAWSVPEPQNPWKSSAPFSDSETQAFIQEGIAEHPLVDLDFAPVAFGMDLVPAAEALRFADAPAGELGPGRGEQTFHAFAASAPATVELRVTGGLIEHYRDRGNVKVELWKLGGESETGERETLVATDRSVPPDGVERTVALPLETPGLYRIDVSDGGDRTNVAWPADQRIAVLSSEDAPMNEAYHQWTAYFYVPRGTSVVGLFGGDHGEVRDSQGRPQFWLNGREPNFYSVPVPEGEDGKTWHIRYGRGAVRLLTVPPCFALSPRGLLLPREVVERDAK